MVSKYTSSKTAAAVSAISTFILNAIGIARLIVTAIVPIEVPVVKEIRHAIIKIIVGSKAGFKSLEKISARYNPVPKSFTVPPIAKANKRTVD